MDVHALIEPLILQNKAKLIEALGSVDQAITDDGMKKTASILHVMLPFPVRMVLKKEAFTALLIANRSRIRELLG